MIHIVGIGLEGVAGLTQSVQQIVEAAALLVGSDRHLSYFPSHPAPRLVLQDFKEAFVEIRRRLTDWEREPRNRSRSPENEQPHVVILVSGDPLFFGLGRLLLTEFPPEQLCFHPHVSSIQLAFNRLKVPWHDAQVISTHGRSLELLTQALQQGVEKIAILTDGTHTPAAISNLISALNLPISYQFWVCENLGGNDERVQHWSKERLKNQGFSPLNVVVLLRQSGEKTPLNLSQMPIFGIPDQAFLSWSDRPGLMTKREVRVLILGELGLQPKQVIWDIGAGTGSVSIEIARLFPDSMVYAIEKTAAGTNLIEDNARRFQVGNVVSIHGEAPDILHHLRSPHRIFIGGSGGKITEILGLCSIRLAPGGVIVLALATLEHLNAAIRWLEERVRIERSWTYRVLQVQLNRSVSVGNLTRFSPLNPVTILTIQHQSLFV